MKHFLIIAILSFTFASACENENKETLKNDIQPPVAQKIPEILEKHGDIRVDDYYWLNDRENPEVIDYLERENDYYQKMTAHTKDLREDLFKEMKARIKEDDTSVPYKYNGYWYITRFETGKDYPIYSRRKGTLDAEEEIIFDCNKMAEGHNYFNLNGISVSPDNKLVSFGLDTVSRRQYTLHVKNLETQEILKDKVENTTGASVWANDSQTLFYTKKDPQTLRSYQIFKHYLGQDSKDDIIVFNETDDTFNTYVYKTKSKDYIIVGSSATLSDEFRILDANKPDEQFKLFAPRMRGLEYGISHFGEYFYIVTNKDDAENFKLMKTPVSSTTPENWVDVLPHRKDILLEDIEIFKDFLVVSERKLGLSQIRIMRWDDSEDYYLPFDNETYAASVGVNPDFDTPILRYRYTSLTTPSSVIDFNMITKTKEVKKEQEVLGGKFDKENYMSERIWAPSQDGKEIPISLVYKKGIKRDGKNPLLQYAYGSYGYTVDPTFSTTRLSLLDRGFVFAIVHIRGGQYLGRQWYEDGKYFNKKNTFTDFIDASSYLIEQKYTSPDHLYAMGGSAGGLLMGAIVNMAPEKYHGVVAAVPFVDVVTTMLDDSIPLTTGEYDEWGNPNELDYYNYMKSYSPYDQVKAQEYPNMLVTTGLHDSQVQYWEPAKWVAKLRDLKTDSNVLFLDTNMKAGHGGASGRFEALKETAKDYVFLLDLEGITE